MSIVDLVLSFLQYILVAMGSVVLYKAITAVKTFLIISLTKVDTKWAQRYGQKSWAIITGCTEGIGKAFCFELASLGFNLILISRNEKKLQALNKQLWKKYPDLNLIIIQKDFSKYNRQLYEGISSRISGVDVSILVNNVGISHIDKFDNQTIKDLEEQINVNVNAMTFMCHKIIPMFLERRKPCGIINLSSQSIAYSLRTLSVYTATKAYNALFSQCLYQDYEGVIDILDCAPAIVSTAGTNYTKDAFSCTSEECARWALKALGKTSYSAGHWTHIVQSWMTLIAGESLTRWIANKKMNDVTSHKKA